MFEFFRFELRQQLRSPVLWLLGALFALVAFFALTTDAVQIGAVLAPIEGVATATEANDKTALTQFLVKQTSDLDVHGFAAKDTPAGVAARD